MDKIPGIEGDRDRQRFIIKVYSLIFIMLGVTSLWCGLVYSSDGLKKFVFGNLWLFYLSCVIIIAQTCGLFCFWRKLRAFPLNYIMLVVWTVTHSYLIGAVMTQYEPPVVIAAALCTTVMFLGLTVYACFSKGEMGYLIGFAISLCLMILMTILISFIIRVKILYQIICALIIALLSIYIIWDTKMIVGGRHKRYQLDLDDFAIGAMILYSDIVTIFLYILQLFGGK